jgi:hypothetical protein
MTNPLLDSWRLLSEPEMRRRIDRLIADTARETVEHTEEPQEEACEH